MVSGIEMTCVEGRDEQIAVVTVIIAWFGRNRKARIR